MLKSIMQILFVLNCAALVTLILFQMSKHSGLGGAFGGGGSHTVFGREEKSDPKRTATSLLAVAFMLLGLLLSLL